MELRPLMPNSTHKNVSVRLNFLNEIVMKTDRSESEISL